jgi:hypothetical protein
VLAIVKNGAKVLREKPEVKYVFPAKLQGLFRVTAMVRVLKVSSSGFYTWRWRTGSRAITAATALPTARQDGQAGI